MTPVLTGQPHLMAVRSATAPTAVAYNSAVSVPVTVLAGPAADVWILSVTPTSAGALDLFITTATGEETVRLLVTAASAPVTGDVQFQLTPPRSGDLVSVYAGSRCVATATTDSSGSARIRGIPVGDYTAYVAGVATDITVTPGVDDVPILDSLAVFGGVLILRGHSLSGAALIGETPVVLEATPDLEVAFCALPSGLDGAYPVRVVSEAGTSYAQTLIIEV